MDNPYNRVSKSADAQQGPYSQQLGAAYLEAVAATRRAVYGEEVPLAAANLSGIIAVQAAEVDHSPTA